MVNYLLSEKLSIINGYFLSILSKKIIQMFQQKLTFYKLQPHQYKKSYQSTVDRLILEKSQLDLALLKKLL